MGSFDVSPRLNFFSRVALTGGRRSPYITIGKNEDIPSLNLNQAYFSHQRKKIKFLFGKFTNPNVRLTPYREILFDNDVSPEGLSITYDTNVFNVVSFYSKLNEQELRGDFSVFSNQINGAFSAQPLVLYTLSYLNIDSDDKILYPDFDLTELSVRFDFSWRDWLIKPTAQIVHNISGDADEDKGFIVSLELINSKLRSKFYLQFQKIEENAVLPALAQDDFLYSSAFKGLILSASKRILKNQKITFWILGGEELSETRKANWRFRIDFDVSF